MARKRITNYRKKDIDGMYNKKTNLMTIYSQRLAGFLMMNGFVLIKLLPNQNNNRNSFIFANTPLLRDYIDKWNMEKLKSVDRRSDSI